MMVEIVILAVITLVLVAVLFLINNDDKPFYKSVRTKNVPIGDPTRNKQRKIRIQIVRDANVTPANGAKCAKIIMDVITQKIIPNVPVQFEYGGLPDYIDDKLLPEDTYDYGVIIICIVQDITDFTVQKDDDGVAGLAISINAKDAKTPGFINGSLYNLILLGQATILGDTGEWLVLHEFGHTFGLRHEQVHPNADIKSGMYKERDDPKLNDPKTYDLGPFFDPKSMMNYKYLTSTFTSGTYPSGYNLSNFENKNAKYSKSDVDAIDATFKPLKSKPGPLKYITKFDPNTIADFTFETIAVPCRTSWGVLDGTCDAIADKSKWIEYKNGMDNGKQMCAFRYYNYPKLCKDFDKKPPAVETK